MKKYLCPICEDEYPIIAFVRDADEDTFEAYSPQDWLNSHVDKVGDTRTLTVGNDEYELSSFCADCGRMIGISRKRMEERLGSGPIKTRRKKDGKYVDLEAHQEYMYMVDEADPQWEFAMDGETTRDGEPLSFTDIDLAKLSMWRIRNVLNNKGFTDIPWHELEDHAQNVSVQFLEKLRCQYCDALCYMPGNEPCGDGAGPAEDIDSLHAYHWACCRGEAKRLMSEYVDRRKAQLPIDVLDVAQAMNMSDEQLVALWHGATSYLDKHEREQPLWKSLTVEGLTVKFDEAGLNLKPQEVKLLRNAMLAHSGTSKEGKNERRVKRLLDKLNDRAPQVYAILMKELKGED